MKTLDRVAQVRSIDPLDHDELVRWTPTFTLDDLMEPRIDIRRRPNRRAVVAIGGGALVLGLGTTAAAVGLLGGSAPDSVRQHLAALDEGMPADLRYNPDVDNTHTVASSPSAVLYKADLADGGYCLEVASAGVRPRGATCLTAVEASHAPLEVTAPIADTDAPQLLVAGRANDAEISAIEARYHDGTSEPIAFGLDRAWLLEVSSEHEASVLASGVTIAALNSDGAVVIAINVPPLRDNDPTGAIGEAMQPIFVSTISDGADLTLVLGIEGRVNVDAAALVLRYPDGTTTPIPMRSDGTYRFDVPAEQHAIFARQAGTLTATDSRGTAIASASVASVAYWRSAQVSP